ncbi:MAG: hypothetical protein WCT18_00415 [Patescibacteria group bacterium]
MPEFDLDQEELEIKENSKIIPWWQRFLMKFFPKYFFKIYADKINVNSDDIELSSNLFENKKIHIQPLSGGSRGFILTLDNKLTLWFYQNGNHFEYDGFEMGEYEDLDILQNVAGFDALKNMGPISKEESDYYNNPDNFKKYQK